VSEGGREGGREGEGDGDIGVVPQSNKLVIYGVTNVHSPPRGTVRCGACTSHQREQLELFEEKKSWKDEIAHK